MEGPPRLGPLVKIRLGLRVWYWFIVVRLGLRRIPLPELVIGLPREPKDKDAHAWVELHGMDVGPPPGRGLHEELARYH